MECNERSRPVPDCLNPPNGVVIDERSNVLTHTVPARNWRAILCALLTSRVHNAAPRPYCESLAMRTASSSLDTRIEPSTGPKISSFQCAFQASRLEDGWWNVDAALCWLYWLATGVNGCAFCLPNADVFIDAIKLCAVNNGSHCRAWIVCVARHDGF